MKIFISWSGELSQKIAQELKKWIPCIINSAEIFFSTEDIEKGERWNSKIMAELEETNYGIVCLTKDNTTAPWINFEAGALAKNVGEAKVCTLLVDLQPSEVSGPLASFQSTILSNKNDFTKLVKGINKSADSPIDDNIIETLLSALWETIDSSCKGIISSYKPTENKKEKNSKESEQRVLEELVMLIRNQNILLNSPEVLLPKDYLKSIYNVSIDKLDIERFIREMLIDITGSEVTVDNFTIGSTIVNEIMHFIRVHDLSRALYMECRSALDKYEKVERRARLIAMSGEKTQVKTKPAYVIDAESGRIVRNMSLEGITNSIEDEGEKIRLE